MELDKNAVNKLLASGDTQLWQFIQMVAASSGIELPSNVSHEEMKNLRAAILGAANSGITAEQATEYLKNMGINYGGGK